ncbi:MAG TPA: hypothetical protein VGR19_12715 [Allosphingosinicella sp.]|nr:hypothetical protein [Allosphingosinicella sp.]
MEVAAEEAEAEAEAEAAAREVGTAVWIGLYLLRLLRLHMR